VPNVYPDTPMDDRVSLEYIGQRLREIRKARGLSQQDVAERMGIPQSNLSRIENGKQRLNLSVLAAVLSIYRMEMDDFFATEGEPRGAAGGEQRVLDLYRSLDPAERQEVLEFLEFKVSRDQGTDGGRFYRGK